MWTERRTDVLKTGRLYRTAGGSGGAMVLGKLPVPGRPTILISVRQGPIALAVGAGGVVWTFLLSSILSPLSPSLWETARYRLKYCLKGPLNPKQPTKYIAQQVRLNRKTGQSQTTNTAPAASTARSALVVLLSKLVGILIGWLFWLNGFLRQYFRLYPAVSRRVGWLVVFGLTAF